MDKTQRVIAILLILSVIFSVFSIVMSFDLVGVNVPENDNSGGSTVQAGSSSGQIQFVIAGDDGGNS